MAIGNSIIKVIIYLFMITYVHGNVCRFDGVIANCTNTNLIEIPNIPGYIEQLIFTGNNLGSVMFETFKNVENTHKIWRLDLAANRIVNITDDAFKSFTDLSFLYLSSNQINVTYLKMLLWNISETHPLDKLYLQRMGPKSINQETFSRLKKTPAINLHMGYNELEEFTTSTLSLLKGLELLNLEHNMITKFELTIMDKLQTLWVGYNQLTSVPAFCIGNTKESFIKNIKWVYLNNNYISSLSNDTFQCLTKVRSIHIESNVIGNFPSFFLESLNNLLVFGSSKNHGHRTKIYPYAFASSTLNFLTLSFDSNALDVFQSIPEAFKGLPNLKTIRLSYANMVRMTETNVSDLFAPLSTVKYFNCFKCSLECDLKSVIGKKPNLTKVNLRENNFQGISPGLFTEKSNITVLKLSYNKISNVHEDSLPIAFLNNLSSFDLSQNPFICDCKLAWFIDWLKAANKSKLLHFPEGYTCASPPMWANRRLDEVHFSYLECHPFTTPEWFGVIGGPIIIVMIFLSLILYRKRWSIKHYVYMLRKKREYAPLPGDQYVYDAFVAYNESNRSWVKNFLVSVLEGEHGLKLCVHERDFTPGVFVNENIVERMRESKKIILVLSNTFATSEWCMFELKIAHSMHIEDNVEVIVILKEEIQAKNMNNSMKVLLENTTYLEWTDDNIGHELFITKLKDAMGVAVNS